MLRKFFSSIRYIGHASSFERYFMNLERNRHSGGPTFQEARRDIVAAYEAGTLGQRIK